MDTPNPNTNPWDNKPLSIDASNPKLPGQVYMLADGQQRCAIRSEQVGQRYQLAPLSGTTLDDGTDFVTDVTQFIQGPPTIESDLSAIDLAQKNAPTVYTLPARDASALAPAIVLTPSAPAAAAPAAIVPPAVSTGKPVTLNAPVHGALLTEIERAEAELNKLTRHMGHEFIKGANAAMNAIRKLTGHPHV